MAIRALFFAILWGVLTEGEKTSVAFGVPFVLLAAAVSRAIEPGGGGRWRARGFVRFVPFFLAHSLRGSIDVAWRALHPRLPLQPLIHEYRPRLPAGPARVLFIGTISLFPGTLCAGVQDGRLRVHVLDGRRFSEHELAAVEERIAALYGLPLPTLEDRGQ